MKARIAAACAIGALIAACATTEPDPVPPPPVAVEPAAEAPTVVEKIPEPPAPKPGLQNLEKGVAAYENAQYRSANKLIAGALQSGLDTADEVRAHKYLAFIACAGGQTGPCRTHFRKALAIDPGFGLTRTEAGHPMWGKVFREVKAQQAKTKH